MDSSSEVHKITQTSLGPRIGAEAIKSKVLLIANTTWYIINFRSRLIEKLLEAGCHIIVAAPRDGYSREPILQRCDYVPLRIDRRGKNPLRELITVYRIARLISMSKPDIVFTWTPKPNIYTTFVGALINVKVIPNIAGLGTVFIRRGVLSGVVSLLYYVSLKHSSLVFFQNNEDLKIFINNGWVSPDAACRLPGSGVDLKRFAPRPLPSGDYAMTFLFAGRLLADKGLRQLVSAARILKEDGFDIRLLVAGFIDPGNPSAILEDELERWQYDGLIDYLGPMKDICRVIAQADCVVLPSYREGVPRILLEAAAMARPVITTDSPGCRDAVVDGETGFLCRRKDVESLRKCMHQVLCLAHYERAVMGLRGRQYVEAHFDEDEVLKRYLIELEKIQCGKLRKYSTSKG